VKPESAIVAVLCAAACAPVDFRFGVDGGEPDAGPHDAGVPCGGCGGLTTLQCDLDAGMCVECLSSMHCFAPYGACDPVTHRCVECVTSLDCGTGSCEPETHHCGKSCTSIAECFLSGADHCSQGHICGSCDDQNDCSTGLQCDVANGQCVECASAADCPPEHPICDRTRGKCVQCTTSVDCLDGEVCDPMEGRCVMR
jgi:hypothetical protein